MEYTFKTRLTEVKELYAEYLTKRERELSSIEEELEALRRMSTRPYPMKGRRYIVLVKRGGRIYFRRSPSKPPTPPKLRAWERFKELTEEAKHLSFDEVARAVGGEVVELPKGGKAIKLPSGEILPKAAAYVRAKMKGEKYALPETQLEKLVKMLKWALAQPLSP